MADNQLPRRPVVITTPTRPQQLHNGYFTTPSSQSASSSLNTPSPITSSSEISNESTAFDQEESEWYQPSEGRRPYHPLDEKYYANRILEYQNNKSSSGRGAIILRHACPQHQQQGFSVRIVPAWATLAEVKVLAAYFWTMPLEELQITGRYDGQDIILRSEQDWAGYYDVCAASNSRVYIDVVRENQYGRNPCNVNVDPRKIWGPIGPFMMPIPIPTTLGGQRNAALGGEVAGNA